MSSSGFASYENRGEQPDHRRPSWSRRGVLLINLGTPDESDVPSVRRYLAEFLSDPEVIHLPTGLGWLNGALGRLIAYFHAPKSAKMYQRIWSDSGSPLESITADQVCKLESHLPDGWRVFPAMRYGRPSIAQTLREIEAAGVEELVVIPMYPQFSGPTTGTALRELYRSLYRGMHRLNVTTRNIWYDDGGYIYAQAKLIAEYAKQHQLTPDNTMLLFSAHGLPVSYVKRGDPYPAHVRRSIDLVAQRLGWPAERWVSAYQSRFGPAKWLKPGTDHLLAELAQRGEKRVLICPISFTADCLETLEELDVRYRELFEDLGGDLYLCPALNTHKDFIDALAGLVLKGPRPVSSWGEKVQPLLSIRPKPDPRPANVDTLVMVGVSLASQIGKGRGPELVHIDGPRFLCAKKPQHEVPDALRKICEDGQVVEGFVWNTCHRFEFFGWASDSACEPNECIVQRIREHLFDGPDSDDLQVNVLCGADAWQHLVRTVSGLNSRLPGDRDVVDQLQQAFNVADRAGTAGPMAAQLIHDAITIENRLREGTDWGDFDPGYCYAAMSNLVSSKQLDFRDRKILVIGGSTTSRSILSALTGRFDVSTRQLTLAYRGHSGGQIKLLRKAIGNGKRLRVGSYAEPAVLKAIADADIVFFGIDRDEPVLSGEQVRDLRDFAARKLTVVDFNTFHSTTGLEAISGVTMIDAEQLDESVRAYADAMCALPEFARAVRAAESWIVKHAPPTNGDCSKPQSCHGLVGEAAGESANGEATHVEDRWQRCAACTGRQGELVDAAGGDGHD